MAPSLDHGVSLEIASGNIVDCYTDAIVLPSTPRLEWEPELARQLRWKAGQTALAAAHRKAPIPLGEAVVTTGGGMLSSFLIHVALLPADEVAAAPEGERRALLSTAVANCFRRCAELPDVTGLGLPNLARCLGFPVGESARLLLAAVGAALAHGGPVCELHLVLQDETEAAVFRGALSP